MLLLPINARSGMDYWYYGRNRIDIQSQPQREDVYTLQGIRLNTPPTTKGIYIANGRKHLK